jgi:hypothetical protein
MQYSAVNFTSLAVKGVPSDQVMPGLIFHVIEVRS